MTADLGLATDDVQERLAAAVDGMPVAAAAGIAAYAWANDFAWRVVETASAGERDVLRSVFSTVESLLEDGLTPDARALLVAGVLDTLQSITTCASAKVRSAIFVDLFGPDTRVEWQRLHAYWGSTDAELIA